MGVVAVVGMIGAISSALIRDRMFPTLAITLYAVILLACGGWIGLPALVFIPFETLDGEFLAEGLARVTATGLWTALVLAYLGSRFLKTKRTTEPSTGQNGSPAAGTPFGQP